MSDPSESKRRAAVVAVGLALAIVMPAQALASPRKADKPARRSPAMEPRTTQTTSSPATEAFTAASDCSVDVTAALNSFIASVPDGSAMTFKPNGCYRVDGTVLVADRNGLTFEGNGATFEARSTQRTGKHWKFLRGGGHAIRDLNVKGAHPNGGKTKAAYVGELSGQHGFDFAGVAGVTLENVSVRDVYGDFVSLGPDDDNRAAWTTDVVVTGSTFERNGRQAFGITGASDVRIEGNIIRGVARSVFDIEPNDGRGGAQRIQLLDNDISEWANALLPVAGRGVVTDIELRDNRIVGEGMRVFVRDLSRADHAQRRENISVIANASDKVSQIPFVIVQDTDGLIVRGNYHEFDPTKKVIAVKTARTTDVVVEDNDFPGAAAETGPKRIK